MFPSRLKILTLLPILDALTTMVSIITILRTITITNLTINPIPYGGADLSPHPLNPVFLEILPYQHILVFIDFSCMAITVLLQKTT